MQSNIVYNMSENDYEKECTYCKNKIRMSKKSGNWLAYNLNNGLHDCRKKNHKEITLEMVRKNSGK